MIHSTLFILSFHGKNFNIEKKLNKKKLHALKKQFNKILLILKITCFEKLFALKNFFC
jgi:hypothetical protein